MQLISCVQNFLQRSTSNRTRPKDNDNVETKTYHHEGLKSHQRRHCSQDDRPTPEKYHIIL